MDRLDLRASSLTANELGRLVAGLVQPTALIELAVVAGCLLLSWLVAHTLRSRLSKPGAVWFGGRIVDGALFPALAFVLALLAQWLLRNLLPLSVFRLAIPILASLALIRVTMRILRMSFPNSGVMRAVERTFSWFAWAVVVLWITGLLPLLMLELDGIHWKIGTTQISVRNIIEGVVSAVLVLMAALWLSSVLEARLLRNAAHHIGVRKMAANAVRAILLFVGLMLALSAAGIDLTALGVLGGAVGVGIGFGLQKLAANYVSGFVILAENSMRIGDMVKVDNFEGRISDITTRYTVIRALNGRESIVPNEMMITQRVENLSLADTRIALNTVVQVAYGTDLDALFPKLKTAVAAVPRVLPELEPTVALTAFASDGLELTIGFWIGDAQTGQGTVRSDANLAILRTLDAAGVEIPYPQRVWRALPGDAAAVAAADAAVVPAAAVPAVADGPAIPGPVSADSSAPTAPAGSR